MAEVFLAVAAGPAGFNKLQVVKVMKPELLEETEHRAMFLDEGRLAARLNHPNIVQTNEVGIQDEHHFIAMEYLDGQPLHRINRRAMRLRQGFPLNWHLYILCEVLGALEYAHEIADYDGRPLRVVHRDVTPHNVFVTYAGQVKLCDFGIAKTMSSSVETRAGVLKGKVSYMAPEQVLGTQIDSRADLFAVGVMLWEAATGRRMWHDQSDLQIMQALSQGRVPSAREANAAVDADLEAIIQRALAPNPADRYQSAADFRSDLENYLFTRTARVNPRQVGEWVVGLFEKERSNLTRVVQDQLVGRSSASMPPPEIARSTSSEQSASNASLQVPQQSNHPSQQAPSLTIPSVEVRALRPHRTLAAVIGALFAVGAFFVAALVLIVTRANSDPPATVEEIGNETQAKAAPPAPTPLAPPTTEPADKTVRLKVKVSPEEATLSLDGKPLQGNPWTGELPRDDKEHELVVSAKGYQSETRQLRLTADKDLEIALKRERTASGWVPPAKAAGKTGSDKDKDEDFPDLSGGKGGKTAAPLDTGDPW